MRAASPAAAASPAMVPTNSGLMTEQQRSSLILEESDSDCSAWAMACPRIAEQAAGRLVAPRSARQSGHTCHE